MIPGSLTAQGEVERLTAENTALRATVARVEALAARLAQIHNRLHGDVEINRQEHRRGERDQIRRVHDDLRAALAGESDGQ